MRKLLLTVLLCFVSLTSFGQGILYSDGVELENEHKIGIMIGVPYLKNVYGKEINQQSSGGLQLHLVTRFNTNKKVNVYTELGFVASMFNYDQFGTEKTASQTNLQLNILPSIVLLKKEGLSLAGLSGLSINSFSGVSDPHPFANNKIKGRYCSYILGTETQILFDSTLIFLGVRGEVPLFMLHSKQTDYNTIDIRRIKMYGLSLTFGLAM